MMSWLFLTDSKLSTDTQSSLTVTTSSPPHLVFVGSWRMMAVSILHSAFLYVWHA